MNFKTTVVLIVLLAVAVGALFFTREKGGDAGTVAQDTRQKLFDVAANDVSKLVVTPADGKRMVLEKSGAKWRMTEPVTAPAEPFEVDNLVRALAELESRGQVDADTASAEATGLAKPRFVVEMATADGKTHTLNVGATPAVGDIVYVAREDDDETHVVPADLIERLDKQPADYRDKKLVDASTGDVRQITLEKPDGKIVIARSGTGDWRITEPRAMPAEKSEVDDILFALTGLRANEFVSEDLSEASAYQLDKPRIRATISSTQPSVHPFVTTAPTATPGGGGAGTQPAPLVINFGQSDLLKKNVIVSTSQSNVIAKVPASIIETIDVKPIELRDRRVIDIDPAQVRSMTIASDRAATTGPTSRPASKNEVVIRRRNESDAKAQATTAPAATTQSTTGPATTQAAATQPASKWKVVSGTASKPADDAKVDALLAQLHPLRAQKYLESAPTTQPAASYVIHVTTVAPGGAEAKHDLKLTDPGDTKPLIGTYNDLAFEADRSLVDRLSGDFLRGSAPTPPSSPPGSFGHDPDAAPFPVGP